MYIFNFPQIGGNQLVFADIKFIDSIGKHHASVNVISLLEDSQHGLQKINTLIQSLRMTNEYHNYPVICTRVSHFKEHTGKKE